MLTLTPIFKIKKLPIEELEELSEDELNYLLYGCISDTARSKSNLEYSKRILGLMTHVNDHPYLGDNQSDMGILHLAIQHNDIELLHLLIEKGASVHYKDINGKTPIFYYFKNPKIVDLFVKAGVDLNAVDCFNMTPLHWSVRTHGVPNIRKIRALLKAGADINAKDIYGRTPLHWSVRENRFISSILLINSGADLEASDNYGYTPLERLPRIWYLIKKHAKRMKKVITSASSLRMKIPKVFLTDEHKLDLINRRYKDNTLLFTILMRCYVFISEYV